jgi:hypothetical protein
MDGIIVRVAKCRSSRKGFGMEENSFFHHKANGIIRLVVNPVHKVGISGDISRYIYKAETADTILNIHDF